MNVTRKQVSVIYANYKQGKIKASQKFFKYAYDYVGNINHGNAFADEILGTVHLAAQEIFNGNIENAQTIINETIEEYDLA